MLIAKDRKPEFQKLINVPPDLLENPYYLSLDFSIADELREAYDELKGPQNTRLAAYEGIYDNILQLLNDIEEKCNELENSCEDANNALYEIKFCL